MFQKRGEMEQVGAAVRLCCNAVGRQRAAVAPLADRRVKGAKRDRTRPDPRATRLRVSMGRTGRTHPLTLWGAARPCWLPFP